MLFAAQTADLSILQPCLWISVSLNHHLSQASPRHCRHHHPQTWRRKGAGPSGSENKGNNDVNRMLKFIYIFCFSCPTKIYSLVRNVFSPSHRPLAPYSKRDWPLYCCHPRQQPVWENSRNSVQMITVDTNISLSLLEETVWKDQ